MDIIEYQILTGSVLDIAVEYRISTGSVLDIVVEYWKKMFGFLLDINIDIETYYFNIGGYWYWSHLSL